MYINRNLRNEMEIISGYYTDKGICKENNQDSICLKVATTSIGTITMAVLCDGMGGLNNGEIASAIAVQVFSQWFDYRLPALLEPFSLESITNQIKEQMWEANGRILSYGRRNHLRMGTTCSVLFLIHDYFYIIVHIGDTRIYELKGDIKLMTRDHTLVEREVSLGHLTPTQARTDRRRNILLQCLGDKESIHPQVTSGQIKKDSVYLLCSDGFYQQCLNKDFSELLPENIISEECITKRLKKLILMCRERKEKDDITTIVIRIMA